MERMNYATEMGEERDEFYYGAGCELCSSTGYKGRTGIFEILQLSDDFRTLLLRNATASELRNQAIKDGMISLMKDGMLKVKMNITTPFEVTRNAYAVE
jgi:type II secretory ATPase GspE/PulE/Tfp pilus assembly ATPase PilB-like protein